MRSKLPILAAVVLPPLATLCAWGENDTPPANLALHKPYTLAPAPNYGYCTDQDGR